MQDLLKKYRDFVRHGYPTVEIEDVDYEEEQPETITFHGWVTKDFPGDDVDFHLHEPYKKKFAQDIDEMWLSVGMRFSLDSLLFPSLTCENSPQEVSITITFHK